MQDLETTAGRRTALRIVADLSAQQSLPMPRQITFYAGNHLELLLEHEDRAGVANWAEQLGLAVAAEDRLIVGDEHSSTFTVVETDRGSCLGFCDVRVKSYCDFIAAGETR